MARPLPLTVLAGPDALAELRDGGLSASRVRVLVGASGGPKWIVLRGLDQVLFPWLLKGAREPVHALGSSIGSWRLACLALPDPLLALDRLTRAYVDEQRYGTRVPTADEVSREGQRIFHALLGGEDVASLVNHATVKLHVVTARFKHIGAWEGRAQMFGLGLAALLNAMSRPLMGLSVERVLFDADGDAGPFAPWGDLPTRHAALTVDNALQAFAASAAIPAVMAGVRDPAGAPVGVYRDGGVTDYHFSREIDPADGIALYPHFYSHLVPGYFDKSLSWRRTRNLRRVVLLAPSPEFVASLPGGKIPDRQDFMNVPEQERIAAWHVALDRSRELGDAFSELVDSGRIRQVVKAFPEA